MKSIMGRLAATAALTLGIGAGFNVAARQLSLEGQPVTAVRVVDANGEVLVQNPPGLPLVAGQPYHSEAERDALKQLFATGLYADIRTLATPVAGGVQIDFVVERNYFVGEVRVSGLREPPSEPKALATMNLALGEPFTDAGLKQALDRLGQALADDGFYQAEWNVQLNRDPATHLVAITVVVRPGPRARFGTITLSNQSRFADRELLGQSGLKIGNDVTSQKIAGAVDHLRGFLAKKGFLTARVGVVRGSYNAARHSLPLQVNVSSGPEIRLVIEGAKIKQKQLQKLIPIYEEGAVDPDLLDEGRRNLRDYFERQGYFNSQVNYTIRAEPQAKVESIVYEIQRGPKRRLVGVEFAGNHYFSDELLTSSLRIEPARFLAPGRFSPRLLQQDEVSIRSLYSASGFRETVVQGSVVEGYQGHKDDLLVRFQIEEGPQTRVASLKIVGNRSLPTEAVLSVVGSTAGQPYSEASVSNDRDNLLALYFNSGFPQAAFQYRSQTVAPNRVALTYLITEGAQVQVGRVLLVGYRHTKPGVIRRQVQIQPGKPYRESDVVATQSRLYDLGIFSRVDVATANPAGTASRKDVLVATTEGQRYTIGYGGGIEVQRLGSTTNATATSLAASPLGIFDFSKLNVFGRGESLNFEARASTLQYRGLFSYQIPDMFASPNFKLVLTGFADKIRDVNTFTGSRYEGSLQLVQNASRSTTFLYRYTFRRVLVNAGSLHIDPNQIPLFSQPTEVSGFGLTWIRDRRNNPADASRGDYNTADISINSTALGSGASFGRLFFQNSTYMPLGHDLVFARSTRFGWEHPFAGSAPDSIPLPERFFAGGGTSIRGFALNQAGPRDPKTGFPLGGLAELVFNQELRFPMQLPWIGNAAGGTLFYDAGNVYTDLSSITFRASPASPAELNYLSHTIGFGIRYATPVGPVRLDVGYLLNPAQFQTTCQTGTAGCVNGFQLSRLPRFQFFFNIGSVF
ncbi:MAG TPA: POTRA domain-containing protein [Candidatus Acidoferrales bacterium]|nr:POTRA domain-containing protein [Candidatus Acidoferrales bacterium]